MRIYILILSDIESRENDEAFSKIVNENKWEWWRRTALTWILATPDSVSTNEILNYAMQSYGATFLTVLEVNINDVGGMYPSKGLPDNIPFLWFDKIRDPNFVPRWVREK